MVLFSSASVEGQYLFLSIGMGIICPFLLLILCVISSSMSTFCNCPLLLNLVVFTNFQMQSSLQPYDPFFAHNAGTAAGIHFGLALFAVSFLSCRCFRMFHLYGFMVPWLLWLWSMYHCRGSMTLLASSSWMGHQFWMVVLGVPLSLLTATVMLSISA